MCRPLLSFEEGPRDGPFWCYLSRHWVGRDELYVVNDGRGRAACSWCVRITVGELSEEERRSVNQVVPVSALTAVNISPTVWHFVCNTCGAVEPARKFATFIDRQRAAICQLCWDYERSKNKSVVAGDPLDPEGGIKRAMKKHGYTDNLTTFRMKPGGWEYEHEDGKHFQFDFNDNMKKPNGTIRRRWSFIF